MDGLSVFWEGCGELSYAERLAQARPRPPAVDREEVSCPCDTCGIAAWCKPALFACEAYQFYIAPPDWHKGQRVTLEYRRQVIETSDAPPTREIYLRIYRQTDDVQAGRPPATRDHGSRYQYYQGCRCELCTDAMREYNRSRKYNRSPEEQAAYLAHKREYQRRRLQSMTPEEMEVFRERKRKADRERKRAKKAVA